MYRRAHKRVCGHVYRHMSGRVCRHVKIYVGWGSLRGCHIVVAYIVMAFIDIYVGWGLFAWPVELSLTCKNKMFAWPVELSLTSWTTTHRTSH